MERAVGFFKELSKQTITRTDMQKLAKEHGVRNGLEPFILQRGWAKKSYGKPNGRKYTVSLLKFIDLTDINPIHVRMVLDDHNKYLCECKQRRKANKKKEGVTASIVSPNTEFEWNAETTKMFAKIYSGNWNSLPMRFRKKNYDGLRIDDKVNQFIKDFIMPEKKQVTITLTETYTRTIRKTIEVPGNVETDKYLEDNSALTEFEDVPRIPNTPFADISQFKLSESEIQWSDNDRDEAGRI